MQFQFFTKKSMLRHVATVHEGKKKVECNICHKILYSSLKEHISIAHEGVKPKRKKAECDICHKILSSSNMKKHILTVHEGVKPKKKEGKLQYLP